MSNVESRLIDDVWHFFINGAEVDEATYLDARTKNRQNGKRFRPPNFTLAPDFFWHRENNGKGRHIGQLDEKPNDPDAYCTSRRELIEKAKRKGFTKIEKV